MDQHLFPEEPKQILRLKRHFSSLGACLVYTFLAIYLFNKGYFRVDTPIFYAGVVIFWLGNMTITSIIRTGFNVRFKDPSLTMGQMLWALLFMLLALYTLDLLRGVVLMSYFTLLSFGNFRFRPGQFLFIVFAAIFGYLGVIILLLYLSPDSISIDTEIAQFIGFVLTSLVLLYTGSVFSELRETNRKQTIALQKALELNTRLATIDDLTGLYTRRHFMDILTKQKALAERDGTDFVLCFADLDHFKYINDSFGHHTGDEVLKTFAEIIKVLIREVDYAARFGGEEFIILLVNTDMEQAIKVAERIRQALESHNFSDLAPALNTTVSIGLSNFRHYNSIQETLVSADNKMYQAKQNGRNMVVHA